MSASGKAWQQPETEIINSDEEVQEKRKFGRKGIEQLEKTGLYPYKPPKDLFKDSKKPAKKKAPMATFLNAEVLEMADVIHSPLFIQDIEIVKRKSKALGQMTSTKKGEVRKTTKTGTGEKKEVEEEHGDQEPENVLDTRKEPEPDKKAESKDNTDKDPDTKKD